MSLPKIQCLLITYIPLLGQGIENKDNCAPCRVVAESPELENNGEQLTKTIPRALFSLTEICTTSTSNKYKHKYKY